MLNFFDKNIYNENKNLLFSFNTDFILFLLSGNFFYKLKKYL